MHRQNELRAGCRNSLAPSTRIVAAHIKQIVRELTLGNYTQAMCLANEALSGVLDHEEILGLLELKNILVRLRMKCEPHVLFGPTTKSRGLPHSFSLEMLDVVQKVLRCRTHYEVLRISHYATYSEVKRAYKRLALRLHPDKNRAPGAEEAFRRISDAADVLTDNQKRIEYNLITAVGGCNRWDLGRTSTEQRRPSTNINNESDDDDRNSSRSSSDEQLPPRRPAYQMANQRVPQMQKLQHSEQLIIGILASALLIFVTLHYAGTAPIYSFTPTSTHSERRLTQLNAVSYYVTPEFAAQHTPDMVAKMEQEIELLYLSDLKQTCQQERNLRQTLLNRARHSHNLNMRMYALKMATPSCYGLYRMSQGNQAAPLLEQKPGGTES